MISSGQTPVGTTNWQVYTGAPNSLYVDVDTSAAGFTTVPSYVCSLGGMQRHWEVLGSTSIYEASRTKFRVYVRFVDGSALTPADANSFGWIIMWIGSAP